MDKEKKGRTVARIAFTKALNVFYAELENKDRNGVMAAFSLLESKAAELESVTEKMCDLLLDSASEDDVVKDVEEADDYRAKYHRAKVDVANFVQTTSSPSPALVDSSISINNAAENSRKFKLPKIELKKFNGDPKEWLQFWSIFSKIHDDASISNEEKFQYLIQAMVENSRANEVMCSYPPTAENYEKVIESLKSRFGRPDLLVEVYVRELLKLVLNKCSGSLTSVYDKLETHLRALESLGVTTDMCAAMLFPLVESSLPEEILRTWQRQNTGSGEAGNRLKSLMKFLENEVRNEERIAIARSGFDLPQEASKTSKSESKSEKKPKQNHNSVATASGLLSVRESKTFVCIFCSANHESADCQKAKKMSLSSRQDIAKEKSACFACLKLNHRSSKCRMKNKCPWCDRKHVLLMCREVSKGEPEVCASVDTKQTENLSALCNDFSPQCKVYLQTLRVVIKGPSGQRVVRALIDSGSHKSYVSGEVAKKLKLKTIGQQKMLHLLFGGNKTEPCLYNEYELNVASINGKYECRLRAFHQE